MQQLNGTSKDIVSENIEKLKELFPEVFSEGKIDFKKLEEELGSFTCNEPERYNFTWAGKSEAKKIAQTPSTGTLRPCKEESKNWDTTQNLYIEGDNLEVLKLLQKSYHKKVKMIYIDPPYNTGKDFVYKDNFRDNIKNYLEITGQVDSDGNKLSTNSETSGRYHSDWLNMMYPRLKLARNLLKDDGVIFISIDDNEVSNLRKLCDEIFGEDNFVGNITVVGNPRGRDYGGIARMHDNILVYSKTNLYEMNNLLDNEKVFPFRDEIGEFEIRELRNRNITFNSNNRPNLYYPFYINPLKQDTNGFFEISLDRKEGWIELYPKASQGVNTVWRWGKPKSLENININIVGKAMVDGGWQIIEKYRERTVMARSVWWDKDVNTEKGTLLLKKIFDGKYFDFPKPIELISRAIEMGSDKNDLILDFFSGSATTAHAVMKLNSEDDGNRKFICVQLPETTDEKSESYKAGYKNICEIGKERIRRAGEKVKSESGKTELDIGFKVLKLDSSNIKSWDSDFENLETNLLDVVENIKSDRNEEDLLYEILLKYGLDLTLPIEEKVIDGKKVFVIGYGALVACLDDDITIPTVEAIAKLKEHYQSEIMRVVFKDTSFKDAVVKTNAYQILKQFGIDEVVSV